MLPTGPPRSRRTVVDNPSSWCNWFSDALTSLSSAVRPAKLFPDPFTLPTASMSTSSRTQPVSSGSSGSKIALRHHTSRDVSETLGIVCVDQSSCPRRRSRVSGREKQYGEGALTMDRYKQAVVGVGSVASKLCAALALTFALRCDTASQYITQYFCSPYATLSVLLQFEVVPYNPEIEWTLPRRR